MTVVPDISNVRLMFLRGIKINKDVLKVIYSKGEKRLFFRGPNQDILSNRRAAWRIRK